MGTVVRVPSYKAGFSGLEAMVFAVVCSGMSIKSLGDATSNSLSSGLQ